MITHKPDSLTFDGNFEVHRKDDLYVSLYSELKAEQSEVKRKLPLKLQVRVHHKNDKIISVGVEQWDYTKSATPDVFSASGLFGGEVAKGYKAFGGAYSAFRLSSRSLLFHKYLLGLKHANLTGYAELSFGETEVSNKNKETGVVTKKMEWQKAVTLRMNGKPYRNMKSGGDLAYNFDSHELNSRVWGQYDLDKETNVRARYSHKDQTVTASLNHNFRGLINLGVVGKVSRII